MAQTRIEWTERVWNPLRGCSRVSEGCRHCYAERMAARFSGPGMPYEGLARSTPNGPRWTGRVELVEEKMSEPLRWRWPSLVFVNSMSDLWHEAVPDVWIDKLFAIMAHTPQHTYQILTKRPQRMLEWFSRSYDEVHDEFIPWWQHPKHWPLPNVWLGVSVENQEAADERIPLLLETPAAVRFVSCEPLLGPVNLQRIDLGLQQTSGYGWRRIEWDALTGWERQFSSEPDTEPRLKALRSYPDRRIHWVIVGGESGPGARPMHPEWARSLRDQCTSAGVPFFFKQWGQWAPNDTYALEHTKAAYLRLDENNFAVSVGKQSAGRLLDGRTWDEMPNGGARA